MSNRSENSSSYSLQDWIKDAAIVKALWDMVFEDDELPSLQEILKKHDKTDARRAIQDLKYEEQKQLSFYAINEARKLRARASTVDEDVTTILKRFRNGPTEPILVNRDEHTYRGVSDIDSTSLTSFGPNIRFGRGDLSTISGADQKEK
jgi:hypothetical protein